MLNSRLATAITSDGIIASMPYGQFFITAKFNHVTEGVVQGPPMQKAIHTSLTLIIGDMDGRQIYSAKTFDLKGVGTSSQRALINCLRSVNVRNQDFELFINTGRDKILNYYNKNYVSILAKAKKAADMKRYEEALYYACYIPECCIGYNDAYKCIMSIMQSYRDNDSETLYNKAYIAWSSSPNSEGARTASLYLSLIEPSSSVYSKSQQLATDIHKTIRCDYIFETRDKYNDSLALKKAYIDAARNIGVAYGCGQKETTTNLFWIK